MKTPVSDQQGSLYCYDPVMRRIPVRVDKMLRLDGNLIGHALTCLLMDELIVVNDDRVEAEKLNRPGWRDMHEHFYCVDMDGDDIVMSRGYALQLKRILRRYNLAVEWVDRRRWRKGPPLGKEEFSYFSHQPDAVRAMRKHQQGIYKAPAGSGKTVTACGFIWETSPMMSLILVDRINLVDQWINRISTHIGIPREEVGRIGEGIWTEGRITVATVQTLYRRRQELEDSGWFDLFDVVILDECHHVTAETFMSLVQQFRARYRLGMSATPDKTGIFDLALNTLGEVFFETTQEELRGLGILVEPHVEVIPTLFEFAYWGDHKATKNGDCDKPKCKNKEPHHKHRNNYAQLKQALVADRDRNQLIIDSIADNRGHVQLVVTDQTTQIEHLLALIPEDWPADRIFTLTGRDKGKKRAAIINLIESGEEAIILSTIAGEALDIPVIDRVHLPFPTRNPRKTEQNVGRGTRTHDDKTDAVIFDYVDPVPVLAKQFRERRWKCYEPLGFKVNVPDGQATGTRRLGSLGK